MVDRQTQCHSWNINIRRFVDIESGELVVSPPTRPRGAGGLVLKSQRLGLRLGRWAEPSTKKRPRSLERVASAFCSFVFIASAR